MLFVRTFVPRNPGSATFVLLRFSRRQKTLPRAHAFPQRRYRGSHKEFYERSIRMQVPFAYDAEVLSQLKRVQEAKVFLNSQRKPLDPSRVVAELSFGFWVGYSARSTRPGCGDRICDGYSAMRQVRWSDRRFTTPSIKSESSGIGSLTTSRFSICRSPCTFESSSICSRGCHRQPRSGLRISLASMKY